MDGTSVAQCAVDVENEMRQMLDVWLNGMTPLNSYFIDGVANARARE